MNTHHPPPVTPHPPPAALTLTLSQTERGQKTQSATGGLPASVVRRRASFTLVELLVVITIIAILVALVYGGLDAARNATQISRTRATIAKLDHLIMAKYDSFRTRRVPIDVSSLLSGTSPATVRQIANLRLQGIREIMRMELPECYLDVTSPPAQLSFGCTVPNTALFNAYAAFYSQKTPAQQEPTYGSAQLLYMIITVGCPNGRQQFSEDEIGDQNGDGWPEFLDAWGNPIMFLRWAPGFTDSSIQTNDPVNQHDPFDPMKTDSSAYQLIPLIYSAGPDGIYDIQQTGTSYNYFSTLSPYTCNGNVLVGAPVVANNYSHTNISVAGNRTIPANLDNIHNHRMGLK
jgi:prepilin-type N-terminal cleavage/methylation domain-containing protein